MNIPVTKVDPENTHVQSIIQTFNLSKTMVTKKGTSIDSTYSPRNVNPEILCKKKQCRILNLDTPNKNMLICFTQILPSRCNIKPSSYSSFDIETSSSDTDTQTTQAKHRTKVDRDSKGIKTSEINSSKSGTRIRTGNHFINIHRNIETITSLVTQASSSTVLQNYDVPDFINNLSKHKSLPNEQVTDPTGSKSNPRPLLTSTKITTSYSSKNMSSIDIDGAKVGRTFNGIKNDHYNRDGNIF